MSLSCRTRSKSKRNENGFEIPTDKQFSADGSMILSPSKIPRSSSSSITTRKNSRPILGNSKIYDISAVLNSQENIAASSSNNNNSTIETKEQCVKKIALSKEEKEMNGAPAGDIYDIVVLDDCDMHPYESLEDARLQFIQNCDTLNESSSWAQKHDTVVVIRRVALHHHEVLGIEEQLAKAVEICCGVIESLRSCNIKNGILCLSTILRKCRSLQCQLCAVNAGKIIAVLLNRTAAGPRFIHDMASGLLHESVENNYIQPSVFIEALVPFVSHRNGDVSCRAFILSSKCIILLDTEALTRNTEGEGEGSISLLENVVNVLHIALNSSKRAKGRESAKDACLHLVSLMGDTSFEAMLLKCLSIYQVGEIYRLLCNIDRTNTFERLMLHYEQSQIEVDSTSAVEAMDKDTDTDTPMDTLALGGRVESPDGVGAGTGEMNVSRSGGRNAEGVMEEKEKEKDRYMSLTPLKTASATKVRAVHATKAIYSNQSGRSGRSGSTKTNKSGSGATQAPSFKQHIQMMKKQQQLAKKKSSSTLPLPSSTLPSIPLPSSTLPLPSIGRSSFGMENGSTGACVAVNVNTPSTTTDVDDNEYNPSEFNHLFMTVGTGTGTGDEVISSTAHAPALLLLSSSSDSPTSSFRHVPESSGSSKILSVCPDDTHTVDDTHAIAHMGMGGGGLGVGMGGMGEDALEHNSSREIEVHSAPSSCRHSTETSKTALPNIIFSSSMMEVGGRGSTSKSSDKASLMEF